MPDVIDLKGVEDCRALPIQPAVAWHVARYTYMLENDNRVEVVLDKFYFTDAITDKAITMIEDAVED